MVLRALRAVKRRGRVTTCNGFAGSVDFDPDAEVFGGTVVNANVLMSFGGKTVAERRKSLRDMVDTYLADCEAAGKVPLRSRETLQEMLLHLFQGRKAFGHHELAFEQSGCPRQRCRQGRPWNVYCLGDAGVLFRQDEQFFGQRGDLLVGIVSLGQEIDPSTMPLR
jgi:hypothetical protein